MSAIQKRAYSHYTKDAVVLLGKLIRLARKDRRMTEHDLADRAGIARGTLQKIEKGNLKCEIGIFFEVATLVGIKLFDSDNSALSMHIDRIDDKIALLPKSIRKNQSTLYDDF